MRRLILQFKKLPAFKSCLRAIAVSTLLTSCEMISSQPFQEVPTRTLVYFDANESSFVMVDPDQCPKSIDQMFFDFRSPYGHHRGKISFPKEGGNTTTIEIDGKKLWGQQPPLFSSEETQQICNEAQQGKASVKLEAKALQERFVNLLREAAPFCHFEYRDTGLTCLLPSLSAVQGKEKIKELEKDLFRFRQRHPYVLARRVALTRKLHRALANPKPERLQELCSIVSLSKKLELPVSMTPAHWQKALCAQEMPTEQINQALAASFYDSYHELHSLLKAFKNTRTGVLTLRLPQDQIPGKDFWVILEPQTIQTESPELSTCFWHPLYQDDLSLILFNNLTGRETSPQLECQLHSGLSKEDLAQQLNDHISFSVCSETEFAISNGRGKVLALPQGTYRYKLRQHSGLFSSELSLAPEDATTLSEGSIQWSRRRPYPVIRSF
ncbi:hypothetical protein [Pseudobacteriovorax antillogorgiicola]|uniref:Lipoprotein n=1 Tax=Pseudobacteriovorax antillogorgiicola TaxID=1513793 RepID=A0A1Y6CV40_9BACT|nr:hypothetical protein [Pseudobacteriovorax antillogorgiicola]TCS44402.1 hypothetical protein EDD56_13329 [Pseudobacteriovorax antillogorgiicola]SMF79247.1 hypothetical protein SAMN06296036_13345 [Pseudobacteriovorax antillogorgiicola]